MARRLVTLEQKAEAVAHYYSNGANALRTAEKTGYSDQSILNWKAINEPQFLALLEAKKREIGAGFATLTERLLERAHADLDQLQITDRNFVSLLGVSAEKALLYAGQPTEIVENRVTITVQEAESKLQRLLPYFPDRAEAIEALRSADPKAAAVLEGEIVEATQE